MDKLFRSVVRSQILHRNILDKTLIHQRCNYCINMKNYEQPRINQPNAGWTFPKYKEFKKRYDRMREENQMSMYDKRSNVIDWNLDSELFAFGKRLNEEFDRSFLLVALTDKSQNEREEQKDLGLVPLPLNDPIEPVEEPHNAQLASEGQTIISEALSSFVERAFPHIPQEAVGGFMDFLTSEEIMEKAARSIGLFDLIICGEKQPNQEILSRAFKAVVGALESSSGKERATQFVLDFVAVNLVEKDIFDLWELEEAYSVAESIFSRSGYKLDPRLVHKVGGNTIEAAYQVALYDQYKSFISTGYGENVDIAKDEAARDALRKLFGMSLSREIIPFDYSQPPQYIDLPQKPLSPKSSQKINASIKDFVIEDASHRFKNITVC